MKGSGFVYRLTGRACLLLLGVMLLTAAWPAARCGARELLFGIEPEHNIFDQMIRYRGLAAYLSEQLEHPVELTILSRYGEVLDRFRSRRLDGAILGSYTAVMVMQDLHLSPLVRVLDAQGMASSSGVVFVRRDSGIRDAAGLRGKSMILVDPSTTEGFLFPAVWVQEATGKQLEDHLERISYAGSHSSAVLTVLDGRADAGAAKKSVFERMVATDPSIGAELEIIAESPLLPETTLCVRQDMPEAMRQKIHRILLGMTNSPEGAKILKTIELGGFINARQSDFDLIAAMKARVAPQPAAP